jgi:competence protein ComEA
MRGTSRFGNFVNGWTVAALLLVIVIAAGLWIIFTKNASGREVVITASLSQAVSGQIYVGGSVNNPGLYPLFPADTLSDVIQAAGGLKDGADSGNISLEIGPPSGAQKIDINHAELWLLEALPGVGEVKARAIIDYRQSHGPFRSTDELLNVPGFGPSALDRLKDLITVGE